MYPENKNSHPTSSPFTESLRDQFAIHLLAHAWKALDIGELGYSGTAQHIWKMADAMIKAREHTHEY